ncbi:MAG: dipeptidase [Mobiluncus sp.]|uniref:dipeptidase n=1 Tax=Mobiluncus sp. TaxID=47293 RepID=UPI0025885558|nr:dipeptidase [Mobiluncus sp.]MCI6585317.1 dipeptidase [Mobiluncus sp.]
MEETALREKMTQDFPAIVGFLKELLKIPSVSSLPEHEKDMVKSAQFVRSQLEGAGVDAKVIQVTDPNTGEVSRPAILGVKAGPENAPTVLLYAHHDVQPAAGQSGWDTPPFEPVEKDGRLYGRGSSDDGAGIAVHLAALRAWGEELPVTVKLFIEGEEEVGSPTFRALLEQNLDFMRSDVIMVADSSNWDPETPALTSGLRGVLSTTVEVRTLTHAVHSGEFGGVALDALTSLCRLLATLHDEKGRVAVPGLKRELEADVDYPEAELREQMGMVPGLELIGEGDLASRMWSQPAISVIGLDAPTVANSSNTLIPSAAARISMRIAPGEDPLSAAAALQKYLENHAPFGAEVKVTINELGPSYAADLEAEATKLMHEALTDAFEKTSVNIGSGGSIPFIATFRELIPEAQILVTGVEDPLSQAHSENESQDLEEMRKAALAEALFFGRLGA